VEVFRSWATSCSGRTPGASGWPPRTSRSGSTAGFRRRWKTKAPSPSRQSSSSTSWTRCRPEMSSSRWTFAPRPSTSDPRSGEVGV